MNELVLRDNEQLHDIFNSLDVRESTILEYKHRIRHFIQFGLQYRGNDIDLLLTYKRSLAASDYSVSTKNKYLVTAKIFLRELYRRQVVPQDFSVNIKSFQQSKKHKVSGLDDHDVELICRWMNDNPSRLRERVLLCLLLFQGLRQAEICDLRVFDVVWREDALFVLGKGQDDKEKVYLHFQTKRALRAYMDKLPAHTEYLFSSLSRKSFNSQLTPRGLRYIIQDIFDELGIDRNVHGFRHYYATNLIKNMPGNLLQVAQFTRHKSVEMLQTYNDAIVDEQEQAKFLYAFDNVSRQLV